MRVSIMVTHLHGIGHLSRMLTLAGALSGIGLRVQIISGGLPVGHLKDGGFDLVQLPPLRSNGTDFANLLDEAGQPAGPDYLERRRTMLVGALTEAPPDVAITELFPFGRRMLAPEFESALTFLTAGVRRPLIYSSVRDVLEPPTRMSKVSSAETMLKRFYDGVLVHSEQAVIPLETSWPVSPQVESMLRYTGFIAAAPEDAAGRVVPDGEILVTAGGGPLGRRLFESAIGAARLFSERPWRILVGGPDVEAECERLAALATGLPVTVEPVRSDYRALLRRCAATVGRCGYNTAVDWFQMGVRGVFVPFADGGQAEQTMRARLLAGRFGVGLVEDHELSPTTLAHAVGKALQGERLNPAAINLDGAAQSGRILVEALQSRA